VSSGFLEGLDLDFHDGLTTILGAKGSGRSVIVELLRFALDQEPTQPEIRRDHDTKLAKQLGAYGRVSVTVKLAKGDEQVIEREYDPTAGNPFHGIPLAPSELVPCHFLSQGEIVRIAESEAEQIRFIDSFFDFRAHQRGLDEIRSQLAAIDRDVARQIRARKAEQALAAEREQLASDISAKDRELASPVFARFQAAQAKSQAAKRAAGTIAALEHALGQARGLIAAVPGAPEAPPDLRSDPLVVRLTDLATRANADANQRITDAVEAVRTFAVDGQAALQEWEPDAARLAGEYSREAQPSGGDMAALSQARARLVAQHRTWKPSFTRPSKSLRS
jgi:DNA repair exonuclease SbcCD ATPase subunit